MRLLIIDDHAIVRQGIRSLIERRPGWLVVGEAASGDEAVRLCKRLMPDIAILDLSMPQRGGLAVLSELVPLTRVLVFTMHEEEEYAPCVIALGGHGYVLKDAPEAEILRAIERVSQGKSYIDPTIAARMLSTPHDIGGETRSLSAREKSVLRLVALGHTNKEIAQNLKVGVRTVETYKARLQAKLGLASRAEMVRYAMAIGLCN